MTDYDSQIYRLHAGSGPFVATAVHHGHDIRPDLLRFIGLPQADRLREEDPFTGVWTTVAPTRVVATQSRFQVDLNRPRETCIYLKPEDCWGLELYAQEPPHQELERSLVEYDNFYRGMHDLLTDITREHKCVVVYDLHSYNHRRQGPDGPAADESMNPQVNVGTGTMDRQRWGSVVDAFIDSLRAYDFPGGQLDVRENIKFKGRGFPRFVHRQFPRAGCAMAVEFKKLFMDEWTGRVDEDAHRAIRAALQSTVPGLLSELAKLGATSLS